MTVTAEFIGYQVFGEDYAPVALYNVRGEHTLAGSTVSADTLRANAIDVPETPGFEEWKRTNEAGE